MTSRYSCCAKRSLRCNIVRHALRGNTQRLRVGLFTENQLVCILGALHHSDHTAEGLDGLPARFLRLAAPVYTNPLAYLINISCCAAAMENNSVETGCENAPS